MTFERISELVAGVPFISAPNARYLYDLIRRERPARILELGIAHGTATCYMAAALEEIGGGTITAVDLTEAATWFQPTPEEQLAKTGLSRFVNLVRMQTGYTWFLHDEIRRLTVNDRCATEYDLCIIDGPKNWTIDGCAFFLVEKILKPNGWLIFDDYYWTYGEADAGRSETDGITHRLLSEAERTTPHVREIFELLVKQHPSFGQLSLSVDQGWAIARKTASDRKTYTIERRESWRSVLMGMLAGLRRRLRKLAGG